MKRVLVAPLDWGLGHATRCIPLIWELIARKCEVYIAGSGASLLLLQTEFPSLTFLRITGYEPIYPTGSTMAWAMAAQLPKFFSAIRNEHKEVQRIVKEHRIDIVISDNRYGCWTKHVPCAFITHQSNILMPKRFGILGGLVRRMNEGFMKKFSICWIPDHPDGSLSGNLMAFGRTIKNVPFEFIGALSRFKALTNPERKYDIVAIFSGPEPQRSIFERIVSVQLKNSGLRYFLVRGIPSGKEVHENSADFLGSEPLQRMICESDLVIARSGYSTIMDLAALSKNAVLIPTPGQTEQEYLAGSLREKRIVFSMLQNEFNLSIALAEAKKYPGFKMNNSDNHLLANALDKLIDGK